MNRTIHSGGKTYCLHGDGQISQVGAAPSGQWLCTGAVRLGRTGKVLESFSLADVLAGKVDQWRWKNGKQRVHLTDLDHGAKRVWMSPEHWVE